MVFSEQKRGLLPWVVLPPIVCPNTEDLGSKVSVNHFPNEVTPSGIGFSRFDEVWGGG